MLTRGRINLKAEDGFTLVELLATMVAGMVVLSAIVTIMAVTLQQTTRTFSRVDATRRARPAFTAIENELHSSCFADQQTPIQVGSSPTSLIFVTSTGTAATPTTVWHEIVYSGSPKYTLADNSYSTSMSTVNGVPTWTRGTLRSSRIVLTNVSQATSGANQPVPVFQYFAFQTAPGTDAAGNQYMILPDGTAPIPGTSTTVFNPLAPGIALSASQAATAG